MNTKQAKIKIAQYEEKSEAAMLRADLYFREADIQRCYDSCKLWNSKADKLRAKFGL